MFVHISVHKYSKVAVSKNIVVEDDHLLDSHGEVRVYPVFILSWVVFVVSIFTDKT